MQSMTMIKNLHIATVIAATCVLAACSSDPVESENESTPASSTQVSYTDEQKARIEYLGRQHGKRAGASGQNIFEYEQAALDVYSNAHRLRRAGYPQLAEIYIQCALAAAEGEQ